MCPFFYLPQIIDLIKLRIAYWIKVKWSDFYIGISEMTDF